MLRILLTTLLIFILSGCDDRDIIVISPSLPPLDCNEYVQRIGADFARRGMLESTMAARAIKKAEADCQAENRRRGY